MLNLIASKDDVVLVNVDECHVHIYKPSTAIHLLSDTVEFEVEYKSPAGEPLHHIQTWIYHKLTNAEVNNQPFIS